MLQSQHAAERRRSLPGMRSVKWSTTGLPVTHDLNSNKGEDSVASTWNALVGQVGNRTSHERCVGPGMHGGNVQASTA